MKLILSSIRLIPPKQKINTYIKYIGRADAEDKWLKESYPETTSEDTDIDYETVEPAERHCSDNEFECVSDHKCIPLEKYCDHSNDCDDHSDESSCATTATPVSGNADANVDGSGVVTEGDGFTGCMEFE